MSDESDPSEIAHRDWRIQSITTLAKAASLTAGLHPAGTVVEGVGFIRHAGLTLDVALPSPVALFLSLATQAELSARRRLVTVFEGVRSGKVDWRTVGSERETALFDGLESRTAAIVLSAMAIEAFANGAIPQYFTYTRPRNAAGELETLDHAGIERFVPILEKYDQILPSVCQVQSPKGGGLWQRITHLIALRDRLVHMKRSSWRGLHPHQSADWIWSRVVKDRASAASWHARDLFMYYEHRDPPRWLIKYSAMYAETFGASA